MSSPLNRLTIYSLYILTFILPIRNVVVLTDYMTIGKLVGFITLIFWIMLKINTKELRLFHTIHIVMILITLFTLIFGVIINNASHIPSLARWSSILFSYCLAIMYWDLVRDDKTLFTLIQFFVLGFVTGGLLVIIEYVQVEGRATGFAISPNHIGSLMVLGVILSTFIINVSKNSITRYANIVFIFVASFAMIATGSRQGLALLTISIPYIFWTIQNINAFKHNILIISLIPLFGYILVYIMPWNIERVLTLPEEILTGDFGGRRDVWEASIRVAQENVLTGVGLTRASEYTEPYLSFGASPHNAFLFVLVETGIFVLILYIIMFIFLMRYIFTRSINHVLFSLTAFTVIIMRNMVSDHFTHSPTIVVLMIIIILSWAFQD